MFDKDLTCPLIKKKCIEHRCHWFIQVQGTNPNTGGSVSEWGCAVAWLPVLLIENAKEVRQGAAATESFRNEVTRLSRGSREISEQISVPTTRVKTLT